MLLPQYMTTTTATAQEQVVSQGQGQVQEPHTTKNNGSNKYNALHCKTFAESSRWNQRAQFPWKIHQMLDDAEIDSFAHIVSWMPDNQAFRAHDTDLFVEQVLPRYFRQTQYKSFQRQLNLWGFERVIVGINQGGYSHKCFVRGDADLCKNMNRLKIKGNGKRKAQPVCSTPNVTRSLFSIKEGGSSPAPRIVSPASPCQVAQGSPVKEVTAIAQLPPLPSTRTKPFRDLFDDETLASVLLLSPESSSPIDSHCTIYANSAIIQGEESNMFNDQLEGMNANELFDGMTFFAI